MGLDVLDKLPPVEVRPNLVVDLSKILGEGASIEFREPKGPELSPSQIRVDKLRAGFAEFSDELLQTCLIMGACYVSKAGEQVDVPRRLATLARTHWDVFLFIAGKFGQAYPRLLVGFDPDEEKNG